MQTPRVPEGPLPAFQFAPPPPKMGEDAELKFGSVILPRVGAGMALLGIGYLVALSIQRGWITPTMQFAGAIVLCLLAIGIGLFKRQEKFDFGQLMIGLGSCGLYVTFAAGHVFQNLYSGETLIGAFVVLSFANLLYGALTPSKTFVSIGLLGGLVASMLPMDQGKDVVSLWLHAAILAPTAWIVGARKAWSYRGRLATIKLEDRRVRKRIILALAANAQLYGGIVKIAPYARIDDNLLHLVVFKGTGFRATARHMIRVFLRMHLNDPEVEIYPTNCVSIEGRNLPVHVDAEPIGFTPVEIRIRPKALRVLVPETANQDLFSKEEAGSPTDLP